MIQAYELRVGNFLYFGLQYVVQVRNINTNMLFASAENSKSGKDEYADMVYFKGEEASGNCRVELLSPITLTPEILEKCGYKVQCNYFFFKKGEKIMIEKMKRGYVVKIKTPYSNGIEIAVIEYLHELQNLIFAISKTELEINL